MQKITIATLVAAAMLSACGGGGEVAEPAAGQDALRGLHQRQFFRALDDAGHAMLLDAAPHSLSDRRRADYRPPCAGGVSSAESWPTPKIPRRKPGVSAASRLTLTDGSLSGPRMR